MILIQGYIYSFYFILILDLELRKKLYFVNQFIFDKTEKYVKNIFSKYCEKKSNQIGKQNYLSLKFVVLNNLWGYDALRRMFLWLLKQPID